MDDLGREIGNFRMCFLRRLLFVNRGDEHLMQFLRSGLVLREQTDII